VGVEVSSPLKHTYALKQFIDAARVRVGVEVSSPFET
jgi:hypothetical protein